MFAAEWRWQGVWNSFPFIAWDLSIQPRTQIWFFNQFICTGEFACSSNLNYAHKVPGKRSECIKMSKRTSKKSKIEHNTLVVLCWHSKNFESNKRQRILFRPQWWDVPYRNHEACCEKLWLVRNLYPNLPQMGQKNYHDMLMPLHDSIPSFMNFRRVLDLLEFKN